ncbi:GPW/gp25 family protein [Cyanobacteria bacterium FACHB-63]|nr:GPW/gp25 family protein [Cyanobacteria bacterium FACHB-63]
MDIDFLGVGWQFPIALDENHQVALSRYEESVQQAIVMILSTAPGERLMNSSFGCGIHDLVFATNSAATLGLIASEVRRSLLDWEARIDVLEINVNSDLREPNRLLIEIRYQVRTTNNRFNLVYPFYLGG